MLGDRCTNVEEIDVGRNEQVDERSIADGMHGVSGSYE